jgi:FKBP-type peptidyl-prolyl cis-trans isomerase
MRSDVKVEEITLGTGACAEHGTVVTLHDRGFLTRGGQFRSADGAAARGPHPTLLVQEA